MFSYGFMNLCRDFKWRYEYFRHIQNLKVNIYFFRVGIVLWDDNFYHFVVRLLNIFNTKFLPNHDFLMSFTYKNILCKISIFRDNL
jgi:hypothetical protein